MPPGAMPPPAFGGSPIGRRALSAALAELQLGAGEEGGNNRGPWVKKYLNGLAPEGSSWCAAFVSWCYREVCAAEAMPFPYTLGARALLGHLKKKGWAYALDSGKAPGAWTWSCCGESGRRDGRPTPALSPTRKTASSTPSKATEAAKSRASTMSSPVWKSCSASRGLRDRQEALKRRSGRWSLGADDLKQGNDCGPRAYARRRPCR